MTTYTTQIKLIATGILEAVDNPVRDASENRQIIRDRARRIIDIAENMDPSRKKRPASSKGS